MRNEGAASFVPWLVAATIFTGASPALAAAPPSFQQQGSFAGAADSFLGYSVAIDGDTAITGAIDDNAGTGAAYVYVRSGATWTLQQKLTAPDGALDDEFGYAVAVSGNTALVGSAGGAAGQGSAYAFTRTGTSWTLQQEITEGATGQVDDCFGCAVALRGDTGLIGAPGASGAGAAFIYLRSGTAWALQSQFLGATANDFFGFSVALSPGGNTAAVGAFGASNERGSAYLFGRAGTAWTQTQAAITASGGQPGDRFGYAVALGDTTAVVGAYAAGPGAAYVFAQSAGTWAQAQKLVPPDPSGSDAFGASVAVSGTTAIVGAYEHTAPTGPGAAYVFASAGATWSQTQELVAPSSGQSYGYAVAVDGTTAAVGAFGAANDSGAVYLLSAAPPPPPAAPALGGRAGAPALMVLLFAVGAVATRRRGGRSS